MKAIRVTRFGGPEVLELSEHELPAPRAGEVLVRLYAAGVNPVETYIRSGQYAKLPTLPYTPGTDGAGKVEAVGEGPSRVAVGDRVYVAGSLSGTYAEFCLCREDQVHPLPNNISFSQGAALGVPYATAYRALFQRGGLQAGETVLIHGATGAVGLAAVQFARTAGASIFATGGSERGRQLLRDLGVDAVFDHHQPDYAEQIRTATSGGGVQLIVEMLANRNLAVDLTLVSPRGRIVVVGSRGPIEINPREAMAREADIRGLMVGNASTGEINEIHASLQEGLIEGSLEPIVDRELPLASAPEAHESVLKPNAKGKLVLTM